MTTSPPSTPSSLPEDFSKLMTVEEYIAAQPRYAWRRRFLRTAVRIILMRILCSVKVIGAENIPDEGGSILMMNHISSLDPILCVGAVTNRFIIPMSKVENLSVPVLGTVIRWYGGFTVNRGEVDRKALTNSIELIKSGQLILIAPEEHRHTNGLIEPKEGLAYVATKADAIIIPATINGAIGWLEAWKHLRRPKITVSFGKPFRFKTSGAKRISREDLTAMSREAMYQLSIALTDTSMRGVFSDLSKATTEFLEFLPEQQ